MTDRLRGSVLHASVIVLCSIPACTPMRHADANLRIIARDYAFDTPASLEPGRTTFQLVNAGHVRHEVQLYRFKPGTTRDAALHMLAVDSIPDSAIDGDGGVLIALPADSARQQLVTTLARGEVYALECAFRDAPNAPQHSRMGMYAVFEVK